LKARTAKRTGASALRARLREVEKRHKVVMAAIRESVYDWDIVRDRFSVARSMQGVLGLPSERLTLAAWQKRIHPDDFPGYREATIAHLKGLTERFEYDYRYRARDGSWRWARTHGVAIRDKKGRAVRMIGSTGDVTQLKHTEEALRASEERYALATAAAVEGIYEWDVESGTLFLSDHAKAFFAFADEALTPAAWNRRVHAEDFALYRSALIEHFKGRSEHLEIEYRVADAHGGYRWVLDRGRAVRNPSGRVTTLVGALSDVTQRKQAEMELRWARDEATEALERQTATAEILRVISSSPTDLAPVFNAVASNAARLCEAPDVAIARIDGDVMRYAASVGPFGKNIGQELVIPLTRDSVAGRAVVDRATIHVHDLAAEADDEYPMGKALQRRYGHRTMMATPLLRGDTVLGVIAVLRTEVKPFTDKQIALLQTFADQAAIAIENVRLFNETKEALEQQTAISEILRVISGSPGDLAAMLGAVAERAVKLCESGEAGIFLHEGEHLRFAAGCQTGVTFRAGETMPVSRGSVLGRALLDGEAVHVLDLAAASLEEFPLGRDYQKRFGHRTIVAVPLKREGRAIGVIGLWRFEVRAFSEKHIALVSTFADQAAIAIESVRLFNEIKEALEQQKASGEILAAIGSSIADTAPVFDRILESCQRLFEGHLVGLTLVGDDGKVHLAAYQGPGREEMQRIYPMPLDCTSGTGCAVRSGRIVDFPQIDDTVPEQIQVGAAILRFKSIVFAPLLAEGVGVGALWVGRLAAGAFEAKQTALLQTFANQAVIAIQNARLFREIQQKSRELEVANRHKSEFLANMSHELRTPLNAIIGFTRIVMRRSKDVLEAKQYENLEKILTSAQHLLQLINAILDLSKVEAGRMELHIGDVQLAPVLEQCLRTVEPLVKAPAVRLVKEFDGELASVYTDEGKLRQIVINLLSNAAKFTERGTVRVTARCGGEAFSVAVADTGIGIAADKLEQVFEEFAQIDASSTRLYGGTGLGLSIARRLARLMGGDIAVESVPGAGSTFTLTLPLRLEP
jgi:two-component system, NtrC family, sensor kinase